MGWWTSLRSNAAVGARLRGMGKSFMGAISDADRVAFNGLRGRGFNLGIDNGIELGKVARRAVGGASRSGMIGAGVGAASGAVMGGEDHRISGALKGGILGGGMGLAGGVLRNNWGIAKSAVRGARL